MRPELTNEQREDLIQQIFDMRDGLEEIESILIHEDEDVYQLRNDLQAVRDRLDRALKFVEDIV
jgi:predicted  nucleic acid-binding Zn-ribbon protein